MPQEKIIIKFSSVGDEALNHAIKQLHASQVLLEKGSKEYQQALKKLNLEQQKALANTGLLATSHRRLGAENKLLARSFATLRSQLLLISFGAMLIERAFVSLVKTYGRQEAANEKLRVGLGNVQDTTEGVTQRLVDYSAALQKTTAFGDEMITTGMVQFTTFGLNEKAIKALTPQVLNVARAIQTVSGTMPDLNSLFIAFGKATTTGIGTLTRYGVVLTETERAQLSSMDANESAVKIAEILERQYGGLADAYAKTTSGMLEAAAAARGDAAEAFGEVLAPAVLKASELLKIMFEAMSPDRIRNFGAGMIIAAGGVGLMTVSVIGLTVSLKALGTALVTTTGGLFAIVIGLGASVGALLTLLGVFDGGNKTLEDSEKRYKELADQMGVTTEELQKAAKATLELQKAQGEGLDALQKRLDLLNATSEIEKMLINLGHEASAKEIEIIAKIAAKIQSLKEEAKTKKDLAKIDEDIEKLEADIAKQKEKIATKALNDEIKRLKQEKKDLRKEIEDEIKLQEELDAIDKELVKTLKALAAADNQLTLANMEKNALLDNQITIQEKLIINDEKWIQVQNELTAAQNAVDVAGQASAQAELNAVKKERISLQLQELNQETQGLILAENRAVLDGKKSALDAEQEIIKIKRNQLEKQYFDILHSDTAPAAERLSYKELVLEIDKQQNELDEKKILLKTQLMDLNLQAAQQVVSAANAAIGAIDSNWKAFDNAEKKKALATARTQKEKDAIEEKYAKKAEDRAKKLHGWKVAAAISNVALGITQTWRDESLPIWAKVIATVAQAAAGYAQIATIRGQEFEHGGMVGGRRHSQGGTMIEAEQGEFVMSRSAVESVGIENLNRMNQGGGGAVTVNVSGNVLSQDFVEGELAENIKEAIRRGTDFGIS